MSKILITGGAGFIGSHTADALLKKGHRVRILDSLAPPVHSGRWPKYISKKFELVRGDVRRKRDLVRALRGVSYVYHFAAYQDQRPDFSKFFETNTVSTALFYEIILEEKLRVKKIILASSQFVYGDGKYQCVHGGSARNTSPARQDVVSGGRIEAGNNFFYPELRTLEQFKSRKFDILCEHGKPAKFLKFKENQQVTPTNSYGLSKKALEDLAFRLGKTHGVPTIAMRYSVVQGERQSPRNLYSGALRIFVTQAIKGKPITVNEDGMETRDFVNVHDVVVANLIVLGSHKADFQIFNVGGGRAYKVLDFAKMVKRIANSDSSIVVGGFRRTDTRHAVSDISKLKKLGWRPRYTPEKSIRDYVEWFRGSRM
jgi:dTDP-L-rhamnose 4-epimerase